MKTNIPTNRRIIKCVKKLLYSISRRVGRSFESGLEFLLYLIRSSKFFHATAVPLSRNRYEMYDRIVKDHQLSDRQLTYLEFGVFRGESLEYWASINKSDKSTFIGFDTFEGLPESWGDLPKGYFSTDGVTPEAKDSRITFQKGLFQDTLRSFINSDQGLVSGSTKKVIHLDADLYSSTLFVLVELYPYLNSGDIILFDELFTVRNNAEEFRAFLDFLAIRRFRFKPIGKTDKEFALECES